MNKYPFVHLESNLLKIYIINISYLLRLRLFTTCSYYGSKEPVLIRPLETSISGDFTSIPRYDKIWVPLHLSRTPFSSASSWTLKVSKRSESSTDVGFGTVDTGDQVCRCLPCSLSRSKTHEYSSTFLNSPLTSEVRHRARRRGPDHLRLDWHKEGLRRQGSSHHPLRGSTPHQNIPPLIGTDTKDHGSETMFQVGGVGNSSDPDSTTSVRKELHVPTVSSVIGSSLPWESCFLFYFFSFFFLSNNYPYCEIFLFGWSNVGGSLRLYKLVLKY